VLKLDDAALRLPIDEFRRGKHTLTYRDGKGPGRIARLRLDLRRRRFRLKATG
jgi:hypothetical protein